MEPERNLATVKVDLGTFELLAKMMREKVAKVRSRVSFAVSDYWQDQVMNTGRLSSRGKARYLRAIEAYSEPKVGVFLNDKIAMLLETGWPAFDMKPGLLLGIRGLPLFGLKKRVIPIKEDGIVKFRTVTEKSTGWIHPGYGGAHLLSRVKKNIPNLIKEILERSQK